MPDGRFEEFLTDASTATWPPAAAIERRGRQRRSRQRWAMTGAGLAVVAVVLAGLALRGVGSTDVAPVPPASPPPPTVSPEATPSSGRSSGSAAPTGSAGTGAAAGSATRSSAAGQPDAGDVSPAAMLRASDVGSGSWDVSQDAGGDWTLNSSLSHCAAAGSGTVPWSDSRYQIIKRGDEHVRQIVLLYPGDRAVAATAEIRAKVGRCASFQSRFNGDAYTMQVRSVGFAVGADESFLVETSGEGWTSVRVFVRHRALLTELGVVPSDDATVLRIGRAAAVRLAEV